MSDLTGLRVLVVEDEAILAWEAEEILKDAGAIVIGPAHNIADAIALIAKGEKIDAAMLDVSLNGTVSMPVAGALEANGVPYIYTTGYAHITKSSSKLIVLEKPYTSTDLITAIRAIVLDAKR
jgi:DNA-binding NtrC family response regulator